MGPRLRRLLTGAAAALGIAAVGGATAWVLRVGAIGASTSLSLPAAAVTAQAQDGMTPIARMAAPPLSLIDQNGRPVSLADFKDKAVVLTFLDPVCWDECPLEAQDMKLMLRFLPPRARSRVALVAVVANPVVHSLAAVRAFDRTERLTSLANWHYLTSPSVAALRRVWGRYFVSVTVPRDAMVDHSQAFYLIAPGGQVRYLSAPNDTLSTFVGTAELLAAYVGRILGQRPTFPAAEPAPSSLLPRPATASPAQRAASVGIAMRGPDDGWMVAWKGGYERLLRTADGGRTWTDQSPAGVTKEGGLLAAFGSGGRAWVVVLPWGYTRTPLTFSTADWGATWRYTGVWPVGTALAGAARPLAAQGRTAYWLTASGLWRASAGGPWQRVAPAPPSVPAGATLTAQKAGAGLVLTGRGGRWTWSAAAGWRPATA